jgi:hypothetical protein
MLRVVDKAAHRTKDRCVRGGQKTEGAAQDSQQDFHHRS